MNSLLERTASLSGLEGRAVIRRVEGDEELKDRLRELGIEEGAEVSMIEHLSPGDLVVKVWSRAFKLDPGLASRLLVDDAGRITQLACLEKGRSAALVKDIGDQTDRPLLPGIDLNPGLMITVIGTGEQERAGDEGCFVRAKVKDRMVAIGQAEAERILVE
jgi:Fe2+ transport system protein FeoA